MQLDFNAKEITLKLVYYGPGLSGKTTNLIALHERSVGDARGRLMTLETRDDRTLFFDLLPLTFTEGTGDKAFSVRIKLFTVPGQVIHRSTRKLVLQGADGVAFIADSQRSETKNNATAFLDLKENLAANGLKLSQLPLVIQFNKRDLPNTRSDQEIADQAKRGREPVFCAIATQGEGVLETFVGLLFVAWTALDASNDLRGRLGMDRDRFLQSVIRHFRETRSLDEILATALCADGHELVRSGGHG